MPPAPPTPAPVWEIIHGFRRYWALVAALDLGLFEALASGPLDAAALAEAVGVDVHRAGLLADALVAMELLTAAPDVPGAGATAESQPPPAPPAPSASSDNAAGPGRLVYNLGLVAANYLLAGGQRSMARLVREAPGPHERWPELAETLRRGAPSTRVEDDPGAFYPDLARGTAPIQRVAAAAVARELAAPRGRQALVVDLGAGAAPWALAFLDAWPDARGLAVELPEVVHVTREAAAADPVGDRLDVVAGSFHRVELPVGGADVVILGHVLRTEPRKAARRLVARAAAALRPGGTLVVADYPRPDVPSSAATTETLMALTILATTGGQGAFRAADLHNWARGAGLTPGATYMPLPGQTVLTATRPGGLSPAAAAGAAGTAGAQPVPRPGLRPLGSVFPPSDSRE
ncbi:MULTISPECIES: acetylserotonin O-methyltransferase [unclassified Pseudofrankia]|uniref:acetylserotonin O-methyltransferase n=1 Tax=unclassified Pseudofrankia TaxID=2994372 RepID=UPI000AC1361D|nr:MULTISPECIES: acetylserotonin O-methyltransferase [unclassified Pseudofrankia]MDT3440093.1 methyltransferase [Pseudofrankia sp. BMG5.37]